MRPRHLLIVGLGLGLVLLPATPALAGGPGAWVDVDEDDPQVELGAVDGGGGGLPGTAGGGGSVCRWERVHDSEVDSLPWGAGEGGLPVEVGSGLEEYAWYWLICPGAEGGQTVDLIPVERGAPPVDPRVLRDEAIEHLALPRPSTAMNPAGDQVVHVSSWLWIDDAVWRTHSRSASAGGVTTTVTATPQRVVWDLGNGDTVVCDGPGTPYDATQPASDQSTDCSYTYAHSSAGRPDDAYQVTATIEWAVDWSVAGASGGGPLPALFTTSPVSVRVGEMQALNQ